MLTRICLKRSGMCFIKYSLVQVGNSCMEVVVGAVLVHSQTHVATWSRSIMTS